METIVNRKGDEDEEGGKRMVMVMMKVGVKMANEVVIRIPWERE